jgi:hypothetical protein
VSAIDSQSASAVSPPHTKSAQSKNLLCERGANHSNLAKTDSNRDNVKPLGMEAKSNQKIGLKLKSVTCP